MKLIYIRSSKPGLYCRRTVIYEGQWVTIKGIALLPALQKYRKWAGFALAIPKTPPNPLPKRYNFHSDKCKETYVINHYPEGKEK